MGVSTSEDGPEGGDLSQVSGSIGSGKYRLFASLGRGGMADVLLGVARGPMGFNKLIVVKRLRSNLADDPTIVSMFLDEARIAARLNHPNVIHTYEVGEQNGAYFIAMEYLDGQPLHVIARTIREKGDVVQPAMWARVVASALNGLHHAHELCDYDGTPMRVVHRDVSPHNIFVTYDGRVKIVDFGIAKAVLNTSQSETGVLKGKIAYMAPEQAMGAPVDRRADIFAAGLILWELLTGARLISGDAAVALNKLLNMEIFPPSSVKSDVPPELDAIVSRALERAPEKRFQTALEMRQALEGYIRSTGTFVAEDEVGALVSALFADRRERVKKQIQVHMASHVEKVAVGTGTLSGSVPSLSLITEPTTRSGLEEDSARSMNGSVQTTETRQAPRSSKVWIMGAVFVGLVLAAGAALIVTRPPATRAAATAPPLPTPIPVVEIRMVHFVVRAAPEGSVLFLDDAPLPSNPYSAKLPVDSLDHRIRASAPGFVQETKFVRFDGGDLSLDFSLKATPQPVASTPTAPEKPAPKPAAPKGEFGDGRPKPAPRPTLETDPWK
jgi:serine/threonine protein kinase